MTRRLSPVPDTPLRAVGLIRVSKERADMLSPELQRTAISDYAAARGYVVTGWMEGLDESASRSKSPWWRRLEQAVAQVEAREVDVILVWKISRAARHRRNWAVALDRVDVAGGRLESATEQFDTATSTGRLARGMLAELAAWEAEVKGEQWRETHAHRLARGLPSNGLSRFGYTYTRGVGYTPDPATGPALVDLYRRYAAGEGFQALCISLNGQGVPTTRGGRWATQTLIRMLDSGFAAGRLDAHDPTCGCGRPRGCARRVHLQGAHERLIDDQLWKAYQRRRDARRVMAPRHRDPTYPLSGLVTCQCGASMTAWSNRARDGTRQPGYLYRCTRWANLRTCPGVWITRARVEAAVKDKLRPFADEAEERARARAGRRVVAVTTRVGRDRVAREVVKIEKAMSQLTVDLAKELVPAGAYRDAMAALGVELEAAVAERDRLAVESEELRGPLDARAVRSVVDDWDRLPAATVREVVARFVTSIEVYRDAAGRPQVRVLLRW